MAGLLQKVAGGALAGLGQGIVANAQALRQERLEQLRQGAADRRHRLGLAHESSERGKDRAARAEEGDKTRAAQKEIAGIRADATTGAAKSRAAAAHEKWLNTPVKVGERITPDGSSEFVHKTNRQLLEDIQQGSVDDARAALRDEIVATAEDQESWTNWFSSKDNATDADIEKAFKLREKNPELTAEEALDQAMGGRFRGGGGPASGQTATPGPMGRQPDTGGGSVRQLPGQGTMEAPYQASTQADIELFKRTAPKGAYIKLPDGKVARKP